MAISKENVLLAVTNQNSGYIRSVEDDICLLPEASLCTFCFASSTAKLYMPDRINNSEGKILGQHVPINYFLMYIMIC